MFRLPIGLPHGVPPPSAGSAAEAPSRPRGLAAIDPRYLQIVSLSLLLAFGIGWLAFDQTLDNVAVILGSIGANFGAGMTGGMAYVYDPEGTAENLINMESLVTCPVTVAHWEDQLKSLLEQHVAETESAKGAEILRRWDVEKANFIQICPKEMLVHLPHPLAHEAQAMPAE